MPAILSPPMVCNPEMSMRKAKDETASNASINKPYTRNGQIFFNWALNDKRSASRGEACLNITKAGANQVVIAISNKIASMSSEGINISRSACSMAA